MPVPPLSDLLGPSGALIGAFLAVVALVRVVIVLWRDHLEADRRDREQRDAAQALASKAIDGMGELADAWRERDAFDAERKRRTDR